MKKTWKILIIIAAAIFLLILLRPFFIVHEGEQALVVRFGRIVRVETSTGLKFKTPLIDRITLYPTKIQSWDGAPKEIPTQNQQFIWVDTTARWRITDPEIFYESVKNINQAQGRLDEIIESSVRTVVTRNSLQEAVRSTNDIFESDAVIPLTDEEILAGVTVGDEGMGEGTEESTSNLEEIEYGRAMLSHEIYSLASVQTEQFGIELMDVVIRQIRYSDQLTRSVYDRMIAERRQEAALFRSRGEGEREFWLGKLERERSAIISGARAEAEKIKGEADAEAARIYADAYNSDREFYNYWRALESYKTILPDLNKTMTTDMEYFNYLYDPD
jgi:membrane protease subunit HflC